MAADIIRRLNRFLVSRRFAVWSLVALAAVFIVGGTLPDLTVLSEKELSQLEQSRPVLFWVSSNLQVYQLVRSPVFLVLPGAIWLSIALCMVRRLRREIPRTGLSGPAREADFEGAASISIDQPLASVSERIRQVLQMHRWRLQEIGENGAVQYYAHKGAQGFWGSVVFHVSLLVFLLGAIASILGRFDAEMVLTEGQTLAFAEDQMLRINGKGRLSPELPGTQVSLDRFESSFVQGKYPVDYAAHLKLMDGPLFLHEEAVRVNQPLKYDRWQIFLHRYGFAPRFEIRDELGRLLFDGFVNLVISRPDQTDYFEVPHLRFRVETRFFPDYEKQGEVAGSRSPTPENPVMRIRALVDGELVEEREISLGETAQFGAYRITFADLRYWAWFGIVYDPGYGLIVIAFVLCVAGLAFRFAVSEKWLHVKVEPQETTSVVSLSGRSRYFPALFEREIGDIGAQLQFRTTESEAKPGSNQ